MSSPPRQVIQQAPRSSCSMLLECFNERHITRQRKRRNPPYSHFISKSPDNFHIKKRLFAILGQFTLEGKGRRGVENYWIQEKGQCMAAAHGKGKDGYRQASGIATGGAFSGDTSKQRTKHAIHVCSSPKCADIGDASIRSTPVSPTRHPANDRWCRLLLHSIPCRTTFPTM